MSTGRRTPGISTVNLGPCVPLFRAIWIAPYDEAARLNSSVVPSASCATRAHNQPRKRSRVVSSLICFYPLATAHSSLGRTHVVRSFRANWAAGRLFQLLATTRQSGKEPRLPCVHAAPTSSQPDTGLSNFVPAVEAHRLAVAHVLGADRTYHGICKPYPSATTRLVR